MTISYWTFCWSYLSRNFVVHFTCSFSSLFDFTIFPIITVRDSNYIQRMLFCHRINTVCGEGLCSTILVSAQHFETHKTQTNSCFGWLVIFLCFRRFNQSVHQLICSENNNKGFSQSYQHFSVCCLLCCIIGMWFAWTDFCGECSPPPPHWSSWKRRLWMCMCGLFVIKCAHVVKACFYPGLCHSWNMFRHIPPHWLSNCAHSS